jgi:hypothetical protein
MNHDQLIKEIYKLLIDLGLYPNNIVGWQTQYAPILTDRMGRKITRAIISHAMSGRNDRRGPHYQDLLKNIYEMLTEEKNNNAAAIIQEAANN